MDWYESKSRRYLLQVVNYTVFMALIWYFSNAPPVKIRSASESFITIAFAHAGALREPCRTLTNEELEKLAQNMRATEDCPRERSPVKILAALEGKVIYNVTLKPPGLFDDGGVDVFYSSRIPAGEHELKIKMDDSVRELGFNHEFNEKVQVDPGQILLISFEKGKGFIVN